MDYFPNCVKCGSNVFLFTCYTTYDETYEVEFWPDGQIDRLHRRDYSKCAEEERSAYRCAKCGWVLADHEGRPLLKAEEIGRWVEELHKDDPDDA
jgi:hypothetical protein